jgi:beta-carotene hydroxylase
MSITKDSDLFAIKQAKSLMGGFAGPTIILSFVLMIFFSLTYIGMISKIISLWTGFLLASLITYGIYTVMHDAVHGSITGKHKSWKWLNDLLGYLAGQILFTSFKAHQKEHLAHHQHTNIADQDPDLYITSDTLWGVIKGSFMALPQQYKYYFKHCWGKANRSDKTIVIIELLLMFSWRGALFIFGYWKVGLISLAATQMGAFMLVILFAWLVHRPYNKIKRYENTSTFVFPGISDSIITWMWLFQNYHSVHHLFPKVPFYKYRELYLKIENVMVKKNAPIIRVMDKKQKNLQCN